MNNNYLSDFRSACIRLGCYFKAINKSAATGLAESKVNFPPGLAAPPSLPQAPSCTLHPIKGPEAAARLPCRGLDARAGLWGDAGHCPAGRTGTGVGGGMTQRSTVTAPGFPCLADSQGPRDAEGTPNPPHRPPRAPLPSPRGRRVDPNFTPTTNPCRQKLSHMWHLLFT